MLKRLVVFLLALLLPTMAHAASGYYSPAASPTTVPCASDAACASLLYVQIGVVTYNGATGSANYKWNGSCPGSPNGTSWVRPSGATTGCFVIQGFGRIAESANTMLGNWTNSTGSVVANALPSCADTLGQHLNYVSGTGVTCGMSTSGAVSVNSITFSPVYPSAHFEIVNPITVTNFPFYFNASETVNPGNALRPNFVVQFGHNLSGGGGAVAPGEPALGFGIEQHYEPSPGEVYGEVHLYYVNAAGVQNRPWSWRIDENSESWNNLMHVGAIQVFNGANPINFFELNAGGMTLLTEEVAGVPTYGLSFTGDTANVQINAVGGVSTQNLLLSNWADVQLFPALRFTDDGYFIMKSADGSVTKASLDWTVGAYTQFGLYGGQGFAFETIGGGPGLALQISGSTGGVQIGSPTGGDPGGAGRINATTYYAAGTIGATCSAGLPSASFASIGGIVTHC